MYKPRTPYDRYDQERGLSFQARGCATSIYWTPLMIHYITRYFATTTNEELAGLVGVSQRTLIRKARQLGLSKDKDWLANIWEERRLMAKAASKAKGYPGCFKPGNMIGEEYRFKKGVTKKNIRL